MAAWIVYQRPGSVYNDEPGISYEYPQSIPNGQQIKQGDTLIVVEPVKIAKEKGQIMGWGMVDHIVSYPGQGANLGKTMFNAVYAFYNELVPRLSFDDLGGDPRNNPRNAILRVPAESEVRIIARLTNASALPRNYEPDERSTPSIAGEAKPELNASNEQWAARRVRQGQAMFRKNMLVLYAGQCAISGYSPSAVVDAAHIVPYSAAEDHDIGNGLLLRADIHNLFDDGLVRVHPRRLVVELSKELKHTPYATLVGQPVRPRIDGTFPSIESLTQHYESFAHR